MGLTTIDATDTATQAILDGEDITERDGVTNKKKLFSDAVNNLRNAKYSIEKFREDLLFGDTENESGGVNTMYSSNATTNYDGITLQHAGPFNNLDVKLYIPSIVLNFGGAQWAVWCGMMMYKDTNNWVILVFYRSYNNNGTNTSILFQKSVGGVRTTGLTHLGSAVAAGDLHLSRSGDVFTAEYNIGGGWQSAGNLTAAIGSDCALRYGNTARQGTQTIQIGSIDITGSLVFHDGSPVIVYNAATVDDAAASIISETFDCSSVLAPNEGTDVKYSISRNGGGSYLIANKNLAFVQAQPDFEILAGGVKLKTHHGNGIDQSESDGITFMTLSAGVDRLAANHGTLFNSGTVAIANHGTVEV